MSAPAAACPRPSHPAHTASQAYSAPLRRKTPSPRSPSPTRPRCNCRRQSCQTACRSPQAGIPAHTARLPSSALSQSQSPRYTSQAPCARHTRPASCHSPSCSRSAPKRKPQARQYTSAPSLSLRLSSQSQGSFPSNTQRGCRRTAKSSRIPKRGASPSPLVRLSTPLSCLQPTAPCLPLAKARASCQKKNNRYPLFLSRSIPPLPHRKTPRLAPRAPPRAPCPSSPAAPFSASIPA